MGWQGPLTHRQAIVWQAYLEDQWERPSRSDFYLMQIACEAAYSNRKRPSKVKLDAFRIEFRGGKKKLDLPVVPGGPRPVTRDDIARIHKERAIAMAKAAKPQERKR